MQVAIQQERVRHCSTAEEEMVTWRKGLYNTSVKDPLNQDPDTNPVFQVNLDPDTDPALKKMKLINFHIFLIN